MREKILLLWAALTVALGALDAVPAHAEQCPATLTFSGTVTSVTEASGYTAPVIVGDGMTGSMTFPTNTPDAFPGSGTSGSLGEYRVGSLVSSTFGMEVLIDSNRWGTDPSAVKFTLKVTVGGGMQFDTFEASLGGGGVHGGFTQFPGLGQGEVLHTSSRVTLHLDDLPDDRNDPVTDAILDDSLPVSGYDITRFDGAKRVRIEAYAVGGMGEAVHAYTVEASVTAFDAEPFVPPVFVPVGDEAALLWGCATVIDGEHLCLIRGTAVNDAHQAAFIGRVGSDDCVVRHDIIGDETVVAVKDGDTFAGYTLSSFLRNTVALGDDGDLFFGAGHGSGTGIFKLAEDGTESVLAATPVAVGGKSLAYVSLVDAADATGGGAEPVLAYGHDAGASTQSVFVLPDVHLLSVGETLGGKTVSSVGYGSINDHWQVVMEVGFSDGTWELWTTQSLDGGETFGALTALVQPGDVIDGITVVEAYDADINDSGRVVFALWDGAGGFGIADLDNILLPISLQASTEGGYLGVNDAGDITYQAVIEGIFALMHLPISNTSPGTDVTTVAGDNGETTLVFDEVTSEGVTNVVPQGTVPPSLPSEYDFKVSEGATATYYDISTTATFSGSVRVCFQYDEALYDDEGAIVIMHYDEASETWNELTSQTIDSSTNTVCGFTSSFSPFVIAERVDPEEVRIDVRPGNADNVVNPGAQGALPVAILSDATFDATTVLPASISLAGAGVRLKPKGTYQTTVKDVDKDGRDDLLVHIDTSGLDVAATATVLSFSGRTLAGRGLVGSDAVTIVP